MVLVGRDRPLEELTGAASDAASGVGRLVLVAGEAGVGKSAVVEALRSRLTGARWLTGSCEAQFTPRPLGPLQDVASGLSPQLHQLLRGGAARVEVFAAVAEALAGPVPTVLVLEDVHWADEATLDLLRFLGRRIRALPALVVATHRTDSGETGRGWRQTLAELARERGTLRIDLAPLDLAAVTELAGPAGLDPEQLHRLTGGNAFFLTELLANDSADLPGSARDAVLGRTVTLSDAARASLDVLAVLGGRIEPEVAVAAGASRGHLDEIVRSGLLAADGRDLRFRHELARLAIEHEISPHRRPELHERAFEALQGNGEDDVARLAFHADEAGRRADAVPLATAAGERAAALGAHQQAAAQFRRALRCVDPGRHHTRAQLHDALADELAFLDRWEESAEQRSAAIELWRSLAEPARVGDDLRRLSTVMWRRCRGPASDRYADDAVTLLEPLGPSPELGWAYLNRSAGSPSIEALTADAARAATVAEQMDFEALRGHLCLAEAELAFRSGGDWESPLRRGLDRAATLGLDQLAGAAYSTLYEYFVSSFRIHAGEADFRRGLAFCDDRELTTYGSCLRGRRALALAETCRWPDALELAGEVLDSQASPVNQLTSRVATALVRMRLDHADPDSVLDPAVAWADSLGETPWVVLTRLARVERHWLIGDNASAHQELTVAERSLTPSFPHEIAEIDRWRRRLDGATPGRADSEATWRGRGCGYRAALALVDRGDPPALGEALARFEAMAAPGAARMVRVRLRQQGHRAAPTGSRRATRLHPLGLTERQHEILELVRAGLTNKEIADRLTISAKTVDHHVSAVLAKLGVATRREAARSSDAVTTVPDHG